MTRELLTAKLNLLTVAHLFIAVRLSTSNNYGVVLCIKSAITPLLSPDRATKGAVVGVFIL